MNEMKNSGSPSPCTDSLAKEPATVSSSSSLEDVANGHYFPSTADPLAVLSANNNETFATPAPASISAAQTSLAPAPNAVSGTFDPLASSMSNIPSASFAPATSTAPNASLLNYSAHVPIMPSLPTSAGQAAAPAPVPNNNTVAEFLYQLTKMLTDDNKEVIEWANGKIEVHNPHKLASDVLHKYFRHSKFASFQRQLNYFGFRKLAGKGKMAPCSYVNDATTSDLRSLLLIKRKTSVTTSKDKNGKKRDRTDSQSEPTGNVGSQSGESATAAVNPVLAGILHQNFSPQPTKRTNVSAPATAKIAVGKGVKHQLNGYLKHPGASLPASNSHLALAQAAVGKGVRHGYSSSKSSARNLSTGNATAALNTTNLTFPDPPHFGGADIESSLSELTTNYRNSLGERATSKGSSESNVSSNSLGGSFGFGMLSRDSSLVDLAMLPPVSSVEPTPVSELANSAMTFVDFPHEELDPNANEGEYS